MAEKVDVEAIRAQLEGMYDLSELERRGYSMDRLVAASSHPKALAEIARIFDRERNSVAAGAPAPDFSLPWLSGGNPDERVTLSDHIGKRPVALAFGSYT